MLFLCQISFVTWSVQEIDREKWEDVTHVMPSAGRGMSHVGSEGRWDTNNSLVFYSPHIILLTKFQGCQRKLNYGKGVADRLFYFNQAVGVNIFYWARVRGLSV